VTGAMSTLTIGTRGSALAMAQTALVQASLAANSPGLTVRVERIATIGDRLIDQPLADIGDKGLFVSEIEDALRAGRIDLAIHSAKDLPTDLPPDLALVAFPVRADPRDVLVSRAGRLADLPAGSRIGTSSPRRICQIAAVRPDLDPRLVRGNVDTRLAKLAAGEYEALVLAAAGLIRLGRTDVITEWLSPSIMLPAVGQGALALQIRADDARLRGLVTPLNDAPTAVTVMTERAFLRRLGGGCSAAAGAYATLGAGGLMLTGLIGHPDGRHVRGVRHGSADAGEALGEALAADLLDRGGTDFLAEARRADAALR